MSLAALKKWNGSDIEFNGFGWDFGGGITPKEGSKVSACDITITLGLNSIDNSKKYPQYLGDTPLSTADEGILEAPIYVDQITWYNNSPD